MLAGEVLAGDEAEWLDPVRREVVELCIEALELRGTAALRMGLPADAETAARSAIERADTRESAWALLIEAHAAHVATSPRRAATFHEFRTRLNERYGLTPSRWLIDQHSRLVQDDSARTPPRAPPQSLPPRLRQASRAAFVGRGDELALLTGAWSRAQSAGPGLAPSRASPGSARRGWAPGSRRTPPRTRAPTCSTAAPTEHLALPYRPWIEILSQCVEGASPTRSSNATWRPTAAQVERFAPVLARRVAQGPARARDPPGDRAVPALRGGQRPCCEAAGEERPLVLFLDDLHWADKPTLSLLCHVVSRGEGLRALLICTFRDSEISEDLTATLAALRRESGVDRIAVGGLEPEDVVALLRVHAGRELSEAGVAFAQGLAHDTSGNPFFLGEMLSHHARAGRCSTRPRAGGSRREHRRLGRPDSVRDVIARTASATPPPICFAPRP